MAGSAQAQKIQEVVSKALTDPHFAKQLQEDGLAAVKGGSGSAAWKKYFEHFATTPNALANIGTSTAAADCTCNSSTWTTLSTAVTPIPTCCGATTTTTTSG